MGNCRDTNLKYNCGDKRQNARCVLYEGYIPNYSKLLDEDCITLEETTEELYKNQEEILKGYDEILNDFDSVLKRLLPFLRGDVDPDLSGETERF